MGDSTCANVSQTWSKLALGAGCYWGTEKYVKRDFQKKLPNSIKRANVGFMAPNPTTAYKNPTYRQVCSGQSGHIEVLDVELTDQASTEQTFTELIKFFFQFHDPTTVNRQGNDTGFQYASFVFVSNDEQRQVVERVMKELQDLVDAKKVKVYEGEKVVTGLGEYNTFFPAHEEHQEYLMKNPSGYCNHRIRFRDWPLN